ncbi:MAG TPA: hypothetical protein VGU19_05460 [Microvirga sp.]|nr:hypothetical protein [Microvirga sp.]
MPFYFIAAAAVFALGGMAYGMYMAGSEDHTLASAHAHNNLLGWVSMAIFGLYYRAVPVAIGRLATVHFAITLVANLIFPFGIGLAVLGTTPLLAAIGGGLEMIGMLLFLVIVFRHRSGLAA